MKTHVRKRFLLTFIVVVFFAFQQMDAQIVGYSLTANSAATSGIAVNFPDQGRVLSNIGLTGVSFSSTNGCTAYGWDVVGTDCFVTSAFSTAQYINLSGSYQMKGNSLVGPRDFKVQYSLNGSTWSDVASGATITLGNSLATYNFTLPSVCENKTTVQIRWVLASLYRLDGGTLSGTTTSHTASLKGVSIAGDAFGAPSTQANSISMISVTSTTIKVGCTNGNGNRRIIVMSTDSAFASFGTNTVVNDYNPSANPVYAGSGIQVVYNGTNSAVTVTVPDATNEYWFRVYECNKMDELIRYNTRYSTQNPKKCKLESIYSPTSANIRLTRATLGATIKTPTTGTITERGIYWSLTSPVDENANLVNENVSTGGVYVIANIPDIPRGQTIYFKGYVTNESGTIMSEESSFNNIPVFSGTGTWETASLWNVKEVPGGSGDATYGSVEDSPYINGTCTLTASNEVTNLTINNTRSLTINPAVVLKVDALLTNNAGSSGLLIKSSSKLANGSLIWQTGTVSGSVEMYSKAYWALNNAAGSKYAWQYFGIPVTTALYETYFSSAYVRAWDESVTSYYDIWAKTNDGTSLQLATGSSLKPGYAYELVQGAPITYTFKGTLNHDDYSVTLPYTSTAYYPGQNMLSNPYTASMKIADMQFGSNTVKAVYLYNTGTYNDWLTSSGESTPGAGPGTYTVSTPATAGVGGVPAEIPSMQGFLVKSQNSQGSVAYTYASLGGSSEMQRAPATSNKICTTIDVKGTKFSDRMWLFVDDNCSTAFDNGYDGPKMLGLSQVSQLYGVGSDGIYQIDALPDMNGAIIGFQPGTETSFTLTFTHLNVSNKYSRVLLQDLVANTITDITASGSTYSFTATSADLVNRFKILTSTDVVNSNTEVKKALANIYLTDNNLVVNNTSDAAGTVCIYDTRGRLMLQYAVGKNTTNRTGLGLSQGVYIVRLNTKVSTQTQQIIIK